MATSIPVTDGERERIRELHGEGWSATRIAKHIGRSVPTVTKQAHKLGLTFDRSQTVNATAAVVADNRARRAAIVGRLYGVAESDLTYLEKADAYQLVEVSAGQVVDYMTDRLPAQDRRALMGAISQAVQTAVRTEQSDTDEHGLPAVDAWLRSVMSRDGDV